MPSPAIAEAIDRVLEAAVADGAVPGVVASVARNGTEIYRGVHGEAGAAGRTIAYDSVFRVASMTKLVTSVALLTLVDDKTIELDRPLRDYRPDFRQPPVLEAFDSASGSYTTRPAHRDATLRELLSHTGGYGYWFLDEALRRASGTAPNLVDPPFLMDDPGTRFRYSSSHDVAGLAIEAVTGQDVGQFFAERIFAPLGMASTGFEPPPESDRLVSVGVRSGGRLAEKPLESHGHPPRGGGGLYSTAGDYQRLLAMLLAGGEPLLSGPSAAEIGSNQIGGLMAEPQTTALPARTNDFIFMDGSQKFGLGVMVETREHPGRRGVGSWGWAGILNTYFWVDPAAGLSAVLLMQIEPFADPACVGVLDRFEAAVYAGLD